MPISEDTHIVSIHSGLDQVLQRKEETDYVTRSCRNQTKLHKLIRGLLEDLRIRGQKERKPLRYEVMQEPNQTTQTHRKS